ncbi:histidine phosphatase family protein [Ruminiclostridium herbifermentans]|uniref:Histidine phosphatase family protein n=1 Tax=Ruminiclostridium herbifermentans TaxID=2488810 RepID=A0A4U7JGH1_9FIRM|nr:histidine phosphatase family protein [Ruminiclostridium herbifermentans]QNU67076.1 histidine phosphatase family protein [Ruminiclostridium herbifermentans]
MVTEICIVRHGETDWNTKKMIQGREDIELNKNGEEQAYLVAKHLKKFQWDAIVSSPLKRALNTAKIIGESVGINEITTIDDFIERDFGKGSGMTLEQQKQIFSDGIIPGKEGDNELAERTRRALDYIVKEYEGKKIIIVSHGAMIKSILKFVSDNTIDTGTTIIKNACLNLIKYENGKWQVELYNSVDYLNSAVNSAKNYYLGKEGCQKMNCAQAVLCAFKNQFEIKENTIDVFRSFGGGNAPEGMCGAYYAARYILQNCSAENQLSELENYFLKHAGDLKCKEIRQGRRLSCVGCVEKNSEFLVDYLEKEA